MPMPLPLPLPSMAFLSNPYLVAALSAALTLLVQVLFRKLNKRHRKPLPKIIPSRLNLFDLSDVRAFEYYLSETNHSYVSGNKLSNEDIRHYAVVWNDAGDGFPSIDKWCKLVFPHIAASIRPDEDRWERFSISVRRPHINIFTCHKTASLLRVFPWHEEINMKLLEKAVRSIKKPGVWWGQSTLVPDSFGYDIKNLLIVLFNVEFVASLESIVENDMRFDNSITRHVRDACVVATCRVTEWFDIALVSPHSSVSV